MPYSVLYAELLLDFSVSQTPSCDPVWGNGVGDDVWGVSMYKQTHTHTDAHTHADPTARQGASEGCWPPAWGLVTGREGR